MFHIPDEKRRMRDEIARLRHENQVMAGVLESERQWRLNSLPELLAAEVRARKAEARVAALEAENAKLREPAYRLPWLPSETVVNQPKSCAKAEIPTDPRVIPSPGRES